MTLIARRSSPAERGFICIDPGLDELPRYRTVEPTVEQLDRQIRRMHNAFLALEHHAADNRGALSPRLRTRLAAFMSEWRELGLRALRPPGDSPADLTIRGTTGVLLDDFILDFNILERQVDEAIAAPTGPEGPGRAIATGLTRGVGRAMLLGLGVVAVGGLAYAMTRRQ